MLLAPLLLAAGMLGVQMANDVPRKVAVAKTANGYQLTVDGKPFFVKGAGGWEHFDLLKECGGNAVRSWEAENLDVCAKAGLMVQVGLPLGVTRHGFDYGDVQPVDAQRRETLDFVRRYKNHPAVLLWAIGNEPEIETTAEQRLPVWKYVEETAKAIKAIDPNHPVITVIGGQYREMLHEVPANCPSLDAIGLNSYADMPTLPETVRQQGYTGPYLVTEFGPRGHWQVEKTPWGLPIEDTSSEKAEMYRAAYRAAIESQPNCLGSFVFLWAQKQEKTHTWYGMFLPDGSPVETIGAMMQVWGSKPGDWPHIGPRRIHAVGGEPIRWLRATAGESLTFEVDAIGGTAEWEVRKDVSDHPGVGGDDEPPTPTLPDLVVSSKGSQVTIRIPNRGNYRLFAVVRNSAGRVATANLPIQVG